MARHAVTNLEIAALLGVNHSTVSRIRRGQRQPSMQVMDRLRQLSGWSLDAQMNARTSNTYPARFDEVTSRIARDARSRP